MQPTAESVDGVDVYAVTWMSGPTQLYLVYELQNPGVWPLGCIYLRAVLANKTTSALQY